MKRCILLIVMAMAAATANAPVCAQTAPEAVITTEPRQDVFYNLQDVLLQAYDSYDAEGSIVNAQWYIEGVSYGITDYDEPLDICFALPGTAGQSGCYELSSGTTVTIGLSVQDNQGAWSAQQTKQIILQQQYKGRKYFIKDHLGSVRTTVDRNGDVLSYDDYYPFGLVMPERSYNIANDHDRYKFTGHERDDEAGLTLDYMNARNYDPVLGRFMQVDPMFDERPGLSTYNYAQNHPMNRIDPTGMLDTWAFNSETGEVQWLNDAGGSKTQYIKVIDGDGKFQSEYEVDGSTAYIGATRNGWAVSPNNLWQDLGENYNSQTNYVYSSDDLKTRYRASKKAGLLYNEILRREGSGQATPITAREYVKSLGTYAAQLENFSNFFSMVGSVQGPNIKVRRTLRGQVARSNILSANLNMKGASISSISAAGLRLQAAGSNLNTWQIYLKNTQGTYSGLGQGRNWVGSALQDYLRIMK